MAGHDSHDDLYPVIAQLTAAVKNTTLYSSTHPQVARCLGKAYANLNGLLKTKPNITLVLIGDHLVADNRPLQSGSAYVTNFTRILRRKSVGRISFVAGVQKTALHELIRDLASEEAPVRSNHGINLGKVDRGIKVDDDGGGVFPGTEVNGSPSAGSGVTEDVLQELLALTAAELDELKEVHICVKKHRKLDVRSVNRMVKGFINEFRHEINPLSLLAKLKSVHEYTFTHVTNVCILTMAQAESLGFSGPHLHSIGVASLLHDVGKMFIPEEILNKPGALTADERKTVETHTVKGARYLMGIEGIEKLAILAAMEHHRKFDGTGYPLIKSGWTPSVTSQMISIADVFDAMRSHRSYQVAIPLENTVDVLRKGSGTSFNPQFVEHFVRLIRYKVPQ